MVSNITPFKIQHKTLLVIPKYTEKDFPTCNCIILFLKLISLADQPRRGKKEKKKSADIILAEPQAAPDVLT